MRNCPTCNNPKNKIIEKEYNYTSKINGGEIPLLSLFECTACGFHYLDGGKVDQAWFDWYYLNVYKTDDKPYSAARLDSLAECVDKNKCWNVLDIGGVDGELMLKLQEYGIWVDVAGVGTKAADDYYGVILSHTLEHIYDVPAMMERVKCSLVRGGLLFIEVPIHLDYSNLKYDMHWQHVNKFRPADLENLLSFNGFTVEVSQQLPDYREYQVWRIVGRYV